MKISPPEGRGTDLVPSASFANRAGRATREQHSTNSNYEGFTEYFRTEVPSYNARVRVRVGLARMFRSRIAYPAYSSQLTPKVAG
eukprot:31479-Pelagococcus_subviridis.AAC.14